MDGSSRQFRVTRLRLRQYRSIAKCDVQLGQLMFLVGPNGSGKSNFLDALRLVSGSLQTTLDHALRDRGGFALVRRHSAGHPTNVGIDLEFTYGDIGGRYRFTLAAVRGGGYRVAEERCTVRMAEFGNEETSFHTRDGELIASTVGRMPSVADDHLFLVKASGYDDFRPVYDGLAGINVFSLNSDLMRQPQASDSGELLAREGGNIASVLERLGTDRPDAKSLVEEYLHLIVPGVVSVNRQSLGSFETLEFRQAVAGDARPWTFPASSMSDGTLRALGVLVALFSGRDTVLSPIGIEEPEIALHPAALAILLDALRDASTQRQVLVTSHSPDLLDSPDIRPGELLAVRSHAGDTIIGPVDAPGANAIRESLYTPGELLRVDHLFPESDDVQLRLLA